MKKSTEIDRYMAQFPEDVSALLDKIRQILAENVAGGEETISYQIPTIRFKGKNLVHFAGYKKHIGFYPSPSGIVHFKKELADYETSKGAIKFPLNKPIPYALITKIVRYRMDEIMEMANKARE